MAAKEGYCVKCKAKKEIKDAQEITMKNGRPATQGLCPDCGTKIFKILWFGTWLAGKYATGYTS